MLTNQTLPQAMLQICLQRIEANVPALLPAQLHDLEHLIIDHGAWAVATALGEALHQKQHEGEPVSMLDSLALITLQAEVQLLATAGMSHAAAA